MEVILSHAIESLVRILGRVKNIIEGLLSGMII